MSDPGSETPKRLEPPVTEASQPFWDATRERRLLLPWCTTCERPFFYPRDVCPVCLRTSFEWREASGGGVVYTYTVEHRPQPSFSADPYIVALVELDEGVRLMSNIVGCLPDEVAVGMAVQVTWEPLSDGRNLPLFERVNRAGVAR